MGMILSWLRKIYNLIDAGVTVIQSGNIDLSSFTTLLSSEVELTTGGTAYKLPSSEQSGRKILAIYNNAGENIYIGGSGVTTSNGYTLADKKHLVIGASAGVYAVCSSSSKTVRILECK